MCQEPTFVHSQKRGKPTSAPAKKRCEVTYENHLAEGFVTGAHLAARKLDREYYLRHTSRLKPTQHACTQKERDKQTAASTQNWCYHSLDENDLAQGGVCI